MTSFLPSIPRCCCSFFSPLSLCALVALSFSHTFTPFDCCPSLLILSFFSSLPLFLSFFNLPFLASFFFFYTSLFAPPAFLLYLSLIFCSPSLLSSLLFPLSFVRSSLSIPPFRSCPTSFVVFFSLPFCLGLSVFRPSYFLTSSHSILPSVFISSFPFFRFLFFLLYLSFFTLSCLLLLILPVSPPSAHLFLPFPPFPLLFPRFLPAECREVVVLLRQPSEGSESSKLAFGNEPGPAGSRTRAGART